MKTHPTARAWEGDAYWKLVVSCISGGKKLRPDHYLDNLTAEDLEQLRAALSSSATYAEQRPNCPARRGGHRDGELPGITTLCEVAQAMRQANVLRELEASELVTSAARKRCGELGLDPNLTNAVIRIVGEEALDRKVKGVVEGFAIQAAGVLMTREQGLKHTELETARLALRKESIAQKQTEIQLAREKFEWNGARESLRQLDTLKAIKANSTLTEDQKLEQARLALFGVAPK